MIRIEHGLTKIECDDVAQAAQLVNMLMSAPAPAMPPPVANGKTPRKPRAAATSTEAPTDRRFTTRPRAIAFVATHPAVELAELAMVLYGENTAAARNKTRLTLGNAVKAGALKRLANGEYRVAG